MSHNDTPTERTFTTAGRLVSAAAVAALAVLAVIAVRRARAALTEELDT